MKNAHDGSAVADPALRILGSLAIMMKRAKERNAELEGENFSQ